MLASVTNGQVSPPAWNDYPPPAFATKRNPSRRTYGPRIAQLAQLLGGGFMGWQRYVADVAGEVDENGRFVYRQVDVTVPRQSGKTWLYGVTMDHRALTLQRARVWYTMQSGKDATDWLLNEHWPSLAAMHDALTLRRAAGSEHIRCRSSGGLIRPFPPQPDALHGKHTDLCIVDEAWSFDLVRGKDIDQAVVPTQATKSNAQVWKVSTAGDDSSTWWLATVEGGRAAVDAERGEGRCYFEWACPDDMDPCEESSWPEYHPAYGRTIGRDAMFAALDQFGPDEFARAYGNRWVHASSRVIPYTLWLAAADVDQRVPPTGSCALGFDVALDRTDAAILAAWRDEDGRLRLEVADYRPAAGWVPERLMELRDRLRPVSITYDAAGPVLDVADRASRLGVELTPLKSRDYTAACSSLLEAFTSEPQMVRYRPHQALDQASSGATRRSVGDSWAWGRRQSGISIAPLTAATSAAWGLDHGSVPIGEFRIF